MVKLRHLHLYTVVLGGDQNLEGTEVGRVRPEFLLGGEVCNLRSQGVELDDVYRARCVSLSKQAHRMHAIRRYGRTGQKFSERGDSFSVFAAGWGVKKICISVIN